MRWWAWGVGVGRSQETKGYGRLASIRRAEQLASICRHALLSLDQAVEKNNSTSACFTTWQELVQLRSIGRAYFKEAWNNFDFFAQICFVSGLGIRVSCTPERCPPDKHLFFLWECANSPPIKESCDPPQSVEDGMCVEEQLFRGLRGFELWAFGRQLYGLCCGCMWIRLLHSFSPNEALGSLVLAFFGMFRDIRTFLSIIFLCVCGFGVMLHAGRTDTDCPEGSDPHGLHAQCLSYWWLVRTYFVGFGEMSLDEIQDSISIIVLCICLLIVQLVLMNTAFVAVITSSFDEVMRISRQVTMPPDCD